MLTYPPALGPAAEAGGVAAAAPIEYTVAVDRYLDQAALGVASRRVYRISLVGWAWAPGFGRASAPGTQAQLGALIKAWIQTGSVCPQ